MRSVGLLSGGQTRQRLVVGAALHRNSQVLAARRSHPPALAGRWEFPGGKVEPGETAAVALRRECREELGVEVTVGAQLGRAQLPDGAVLIVFWAELADPRSEPVALEHSQIRWCEPADLALLNWLDTNRELARQAAVRVRAPR